MIEIRESDFSSFFETPFVIYPRDSLFVSPLASDLARIVDFQRNPFFSPGSGTYFTALRDGRPVGRIVAHVHTEANRRFQESVCSFGYFDCIPEQGVASALLERAKQFARSRGCSTLRGNLNLTANQEIGVITEHHERPPFLAQIYNPPYLPGLLEAYGFLNVKPMTTFLNDNVAAFDSESLLTDKHRRLMNDARFSSRPFKAGNPDGDLEIIRTVLNEGMKNNFMFVPMTPEQARFQLDPVKSILDAELIRLAHYDDEPVGVLLCLPDINPLLRKMRGRLLPFGWLTFLAGRRKIRDASLIIIMVKPERQNLGIIRILAYQLIQVLQRKGYQRLASTWIGDDNVASLRSAEVVQMKPYHRLGIYEMRIS